MWFIRGWFRELGLVKSRFIEERTIILMDNAIPVDVQTKHMLKKPYQHNNNDTVGYISYYKKTN